MTTVFNRCFLLHLALWSVMIWSVHCSEKRCVCKMCPQFSTPEAHCECCVWHFYGKRGMPGADISIRSGSLPPAIAAADTAAAAAATSSDDNTNVDELPCSLDLYSNPDTRIRFTASLKTIGQKLRCLLQLKKSIQRNQNSFFL